MQLYTDNKRTMYTLWPKFFVWKTTLNKYMVLKRRNTTIENQLRSTITRNQFHENGLNSNEVAWTKNQYLNLLLGLMEWRYRPGRRACRTGPLRPAPWALSHPHGRTLRLLYSGWKFPVGHLKWKEKKRREKNQRFVTSFSKLCKLSCIQKQSNFFMNNKNYFLNSYSGHTVTRSKTTYNMFYHFKHFGMKQPIRLATL